MAITPIIPNFNKQAGNPTLQVPTAPKIQSPAPPIIKPIAAQPTVRPQAAVSNNITNYGQLGNTQFNTPKPAQPNQPTQPNQNFSTTSNGVANQTVTQLPGQTSNGTFDPNYTPTSEADALNPAYDKYTSNKYLANYYQSKGINFDASKLPSSFDEEAKTFLGQQDTQKTQMDQSIQAAKDTATRQANEAKSANTVQFAQNREGVTSQGNVASGNQVRNVINTNYTNQINSLDNQSEQLNQQLQDNQKNYIAGREQEVRSQLASVEAQKQKVIEAQNQQQTQSTALLGVLDKSGALANLSPEDQQFIAQGMPGVPPGIIQAMSMAATKSVASKDDKDAFDQEQKEMETFKGMATEGIQMSYSTMKQFAQNTGLPIDALMDFNEKAKAVMQTKGLDQQEQQARIAKLGNELDQQKQGIFNEAQSNAVYLKKMYQNGESPDAIAAFKSAAHITDQSDPKYQADLALQQASATIKQKEANGEPITAEDRLKEVQANEQLSYMNGGVGGSDMAYVPKSSQEGIKVSTENGKYTVTAPPGKQFQCGAFVNRTWGANVFGSLGTQKMAVVDKMGFPTKGASSEELASKVKPGMAFVMPIANNAYDHVGLVQTITANGITTIEANANGKATTASVGPGTSNVTSGRFIPWSQLYGFVPPPNSSVNQVGKSANNYNSFLQEAKDKGLPYADAQKYATEKTTAALNNGGDDNSPAIKPTYEQYGLLANTDFNPGNSTDKAASMYLDSYIKNGALPTSRALGIGTGKDSSGQFSAAAARANDLYFAATGQSLPDVQTLKANKDIISGNNKILNNLNVQEGTIGANFKLAINNLDKSGLNQGNQTINGWLNSMKNTMGDPATSQYLTQNATLQNEVGNLLALRNASGTTVADKLESAGLVPANASEDQQKAILKTLMQEAENGRTALQSTNADLYKQIDPLERSANNPNRKTDTTHGSAGPQTYGDFKANIQKMADSGAIHTTTILGELRNNPATKEWVENAIAHADPKNPQKDYQAIINYYLQQS